MNKIGSESWPAPWFIHGVLRVLCLLGCVTLGYGLLIQANLVVGILIIVFFFAILCISTPFRRFGSKHFRAEAVHFDTNLVELDVAGAEYWKDDPAIKDYAGSLDLLDFKGFYVRDISVRVGEMVQRLAICVKINFDGSNPEKTLKLFRSIRVFDPKASTEWRSWLKIRLREKVALVIALLAIKGELSIFIHEDMAKQLNELLMQNLEREICILGGEFIFKASYQLLAPNEDVKEFLLSERADLVSEPTITHIVGSLPCVPEK